MFHISPALQALGCLPKACVCEIKAIATSDSKSKVVFILPFGSGLKFQSFDLFPRAVSAHLNIFLFTQHNFSRARDHNRTVQEVVGKNEVDV